MRVLAFLVIVGMTGCAAAPRQRLETTLVAPTHLAPPAWHVVFADSTFAIRLDTATVTPLAQRHVRVRLYQALLGTPDNPANASLYERGVRGFLRLVELRCPTGAPVSVREGPVATYGTSGERRAEFGEFGALTWMTPTPDSRLGRADAAICAQVEAPAAAGGA